MDKKRGDVATEKPRSVAGRTIAVLLLAVAVLVGMRALRKTRDSRIVTQLPPQASHEWEIRLLGGRIETLEDGGLRVTCRAVPEAVIPHILHLENVVAIDLSNSTAPEDTIVQLPQVGGLKALRLADTQLADNGLMKLMASSSLQSLDLSGTQITESGLKHLAALPNLKALYLNRIPVSDEGLKSLSELTRLNLLFLERGADVEASAASAPRITDAGLEHLKGLRALQLLDLRGTHVTEHGVARLQTALPGCRIVHQAN